ncbi:MAG: hypothetical protein R8K54_02865 [Mariprofundaceae bacterium]
MRKLLMLSACVLTYVLPLTAIADDGLSVDALFDKTGDKLVDASDWGLMTELEQAAYARASVQALGEDPDVMLVDGKSRAESYLAGLRAVYK